MQSTNDCKTRTESLASCLSCSLSSLVENGSCEDRNQPGWTRIILRRPLVSTTTTMPATSPTSTILSNNDDNHDHRSSDDADEFGLMKSSPTGRWGESSSMVRDTVLPELPKLVVRQKLRKFRHLVLPQAISPAYLDSLFPKLLEYFDPQTVHYNGGIAQVKEWKISCYLEVMKGGIPCTNPNMKLLELFRPLLDTCNTLFLEWYRQQHACNHRTTSTPGSTPVQRTCQRLMTFVTRYTPAPGEQALLKHVDGAGKVAGSIVVSLPVDRWSAPEEENSFVGHGGGLTFWDGKDPQTKRLQEIHYDTRCGDLAFIDRAVWHQADPITKGTRWALVIFYDIQES